MVEGLDRRMPLLTAARRVLQMRLRSMAGILAKARRASADQPEPIHQLRVATRRAEAALAVFGPCIRGSRRRKARKLMREIREAAGDARMADVHLTILRTKLESAPPSDRTALEYAVMRTLVARQTAGQSVQRIANKDTTRTLRKIARRVMASLRIPPEHLAADLGVAAGLEPFRAVVLQDAAHTALPKLAQKFRTAAAEDLATQEGLHGLRLRVKPLRYAMEIFSVCLDETLLETLYNELSALQERLGAINDALEVSQRLEGYLREMHAVLTISEDAPEGLAGGLARLIAAYRAESAAAHESFLHWWRGPHASEFQLLIDRLFGRTGASECTAMDARLVRSAPEVVVVNQTIEMFTSAPANGEAHHRAEPLSPVESGESA
jgi:CHAD domain-containing protein